MTFPLYMHDAFGYPVGMALAVLLGFGFGLALEGAGFGKASNLVSQFYGNDMRVLKVMFTAIAVNVIGLGLLGGLGVVELGALEFPLTFLWPQLFGGLLFGVGFVTSGSCPGTAFVAASSGYLDGFVTLLGVALGALVFGFAWPVLENSYGAGAMGKLTFVELLGVPWPLLAMAVGVIAAGAFFGAEWVERWLAQRNSTDVPAGDVTTRNSVLALVAVGALAGVATLALPAPQPAAPGVAVATVDAQTLARTLIERPQSMWIVDLRATDACEAKRIPGALCLPADDPDANFLETLPPTRQLVLYGAADVDPLPAAASRFQGEVAVLGGGWQAFADTALAAPAVPENPTVDRVEEYELLAALHGHFTGSSVQRAPVKVAPTAVKRAVKKGGGC